MQRTSFNTLFLILQIATVAVFLGRAWQHLYWDAPYRVLLWDESWMRPIIEGIFQTKWEDYVTNLDVDKGIQTFIRCTGGFYVLCAIMAMLIQKFKKVAIIILWMGAASLFLLASLYAKDRFFQAAQLLEYALQFSTPVFLIILYKQQAVSQRLIFAMKIAIALTFTCHGMYAIGFGNAQRSVEFMNMTMSILHVSERGAVYFLKTVGILDIIASILIFLPFRIAVVALWYCVGWGMLTCIARMWSHFYLENWQGTLLQWLHESVYRFPHFLIPLFVVLVIWYWRRDEKL